MGGGPWTKAMSTPLITFTITYYTRLLYILFLDQNQVFLKYFNKCRYNKVQRYIEAFKKAHVLGFLIQPPHAHLIHGHLTKAR